MTLNAYHTSTRMKTIKIYGGIGADFTYIKKEAYAF